MATGKRWPLPGEGWFFRALYSASVLDALSLAAERQHPLPETLRALAESDPRGWIRRRLKQALVDIEAGREWCESLYAQGLLRRTDVAVLRSAQRTGNLAWAIQEMADGNRRSFFRRLETCIHIGLPPIVIMIGIVVLFIVAALFLPLVVMIESLT